MIVLADILPTIYMLGMPVLVLVAVCMVLVARQRRDDERRGLLVGGFVLALVALTWVDVVHNMLVEGHMLGCWWLPYVLHAIPLVVFVLLLGSHDEERRRWTVGAAWRVALWAVLLPFIPWHGMKVVGIDLIGMRNATVEELRAELGSYHVIHEEHMREEWETPGTGHIREWTEHNNVGPLCDFDFATLSPGEDLLLSRHGGSVRIKIEEGRARSFYMHLD